MKITRRQLRRIIREELSYTVDADGMKWAKIPEEELKYEQFGNCGMVAIALAEEAEARGMGDVLVILVHDEGVNPLVVEDPRWPPSLYHVAVSINGVFYDDRSIDRGPIPHDQLTVVAGQDLREYDEIQISSFPLNSDVRKAIELGTTHSKCPTDFRERASEILAKYLR